jgi:hypothetical protein
MLFSSGIFLRIPSLNSLTESLHWWSTHQKGQVAKLLFKDSCCSKLSLLLMGLLPEAFTEKLDPLSIQS